MHRRWTFATASKIVCSSSVSRRARASSFAKILSRTLGVRLGVHVPQIFAKRFLSELAGVDQVAVVRECDAVWRVDVERLRFFRRLAPRGGVADVPDAHSSAERTHVMRREDVADQPFGLAFVNFAVAGEDAGGVLSAMLQRGQSVNQILIDFSLSDDPDDTAHRSCVRWLVNPRTGGPPARMTMGMIASTATAEKRFGR